MNEINIEWQPAFKRAAKKLPANQKADLDNAVSLIAKNPHIGKAKSNNLSGVFMRWGFMLVFES